MEYPKEILNAITEIIHQGILRIRLQGFDRKYDWIVIETDHIHNLPALITDYSDDLLKFYWNIERTCYIEQMPVNQLKSIERDFSEHWKKLESFILKL